MDAIEMVQRRAARFVTGQYNRYQCHVDAPGAEMNIYTTETARTAIGKPLQMRNQHQRYPDTTLCRKTNKNDKRTTQ
jgi:hypothetical protein